MATRDDATARTLQARLAAGFRVDDFFPEAADLPENIRAGELEARYGGVGGRLFRQYAVEVGRSLTPILSLRQERPGDQQSRFHPRNLPGGEQVHDHVAYRHFGDRRPIVHVGLLAFVVHPELARSMAVGYARIAHLSAPRVTSAVNRPSPSGVMTKRPRA